WCEVVIVSVCRRVWCVICVYMCVGGGVCRVLICVYMCVGGGEAACAYVIALMAVYWCTEVLPLAVTSLLPTILFPVLGIMESKDVCVQYLKDTNFLFVGGLMMAVAVEHWDLHKRIALRVLLLVGPWFRLMLGFMSVTAFLSMWISNTATTAMMVPIVQAVLDQLHGGEDLNQTETRPDMVLSLELEEVSDGEEEERLRRSKGLLLCVCYAASIGGIATLTGTGPNLVLVGQMSQLFPENGDVVNFASWFGFAFPTMLLMLLLAWFWLQFLYIGCKTWGCGSSPSEKEQAAYRLIQDEHRRLGPVSYAQGSVLLLFCLMVALWFTRDPRFMDGWATNLFNSNKEYVTDATVALFVAVLLFVLPSEPPTYLCFWRNAPSEPSVSSGPAPPLLTWQVTQKKMPWNIVLLLGGGFALAKGRVRSVAWLGEQMAPLQLIPPWAVAVLICLLVATFTECASNVATATLFLPILAQSMSLNPLYVMIPCTLSASFAFMLPVATPPNAIVFSYGYLKVSDMARTGVVMNIFGICCINLAINTWGQALFRLDTFPEWANATAPV
uniref:Solute carrier family 13 member 5 n=1 Tax=Neogobius melanostomus TaxID=47308 RepID=A0A8C6TUL6_9GOBI